MWFGGKDADGHPVTWEGVRRLLIRVAVAGPALYGLARGANALLGT